jgi:hypothetical protein
MNWLELAQDSGWDYHYGSIKVLISQIIIKW